MEFYMGCRLLIFCFTKPLLIYISVPFSQWTLDMTTIFYSHVQVSGKSTFNRKGRLIKIVYVNLIRFLQIIASH